MSGVWLLAGRRQHPCQHRAGGDDLPATAAGLHHHHCQRQGHVIVAILSDLDRASPRHDTADGANPFPGAVPSSSSAAISPTAPLPACPAGGHQHRHLPRTAVVTDQCVAVVAGASSAIGTEIAAHLARAGFPVFGASRGIPSKAPAGTEHVAIDDTDDPSVRTVGTVMERTGRIDVLVTNAGRSRTPRRG